MSQQDSDIEVFTKANEIILRSLLGEAFVDLKKKQPGWKILRNQIEISDEIISALVDVQQCQKLTNSLLVFLNMGTIPTRLGRTRDLTRKIIVGASKLNMKPGMACRTVFKLKLTPLVNDLAAAG